MAKKGGSGGGKAVGKSGIGRSAVTGKFVTKKYVKAHPNTTVVEQAGKPQRTGSGKKSK